MKSVSETVSGKIILSGEHSVVYGLPAIAIPHQRVCETTISLNQTKDIIFQFIDFNISIRSNLKQLVSLKKRLIKKHNSFLNNKCSAVDIIKNPYELLQFAFITAFQYCQGFLEKGLNVSIKSNIPIGFGMGSSAASIVSLFKAVFSYFNFPVTDNILLKLALDVERLQHGYSSGLDIAVSYYNKPIYFQNGLVFPLNIQTTSLPLYIIYTGVPSSNTGQCVEHVKTTLQPNTLYSFKKTTENMFLALNKNLPSLFINTVRENHALLSNIGVVPLFIQSFIQDIEHIGGACKISGAGAVSGDTAGVLLATCNSYKNLKKICDIYKFNIEPIEIFNGINEDVQENSETETLTIKNLFEKILNM